MSTFLGANPEGLDQLARNLMACAATVDTHRSSLGRQLQSTPWHGQSADRFRADWNNRYTRLLAAWTDSMRVAAHSLQVQAAQQRAASGSDGAPVGRSSVEPASLSGLGDIASGAGKVLDRGELMASGILTALHATEVTWLSDRVSETADFFGRVFRPHGAAGRFISPSSLTQVERELMVLQGKGMAFTNGTWRVLSDVTKPLGLLGVGMSGLSVWEGIRDHDSGELISGGAGIGSTVLTSVVEPLAAGAGAAGVAVGAAAVGVASGAAWRMRMSRCRSVTKRLVSHTTTP